ncbi:DUF4334 domain-containing protein [Paraliobacillus sediminis]|uniref:DUF4334 domain-containing protein n=1 Tax=Paraliobacillus sediminis TaxID=1885916 RepID=UPI000E3C8B8B|nr:DUF4334 domain-containing protein [Paraliobacillus sediminis]
MSKKEDLEQMLRDGASQAEAFQLFDALEVVNFETMWGLWKGSEITTGQPMEGLLTAAGWYGKRFENPESVYPLVFQKPDGTLFTGNPALLPLSLPFDKVSLKSISIGMKVVRPFFTTEKSSARLRIMDYRGKPSASMVYDAKAIIDIFRKVDETTLMGVMDIKNIKQDMSYFFVLRKIR